MSGNKTKQDEHSELLKRENTDPLKPGHHVEVILRLGAHEPVDRAIQRQETAERLKQAGTAGDYKVHKLNFYFGELAFLQFKGGLSWEMRDGPAPKDESKAHSPDTPT